MVDKSQKTIPKNSQDPIQQKLLLKPLKTQIGFMLLRQVTWGLAKVGHEVVSIGSSTHPSFGSGLTSNDEHW